MRQQFRTDGVATLAQSRLTGSPYFNVRRLSCSFHDGVLTLRGWLPSFYEKQVAQSTVADLDGVRQIVNEVEVSSNP